MAGTAVVYSMVISNPKRGGDELGSVQMWYSVLRNLHYIL